MAPVTQFNLLKEDTQIMAEELPNVLPPKGMSSERKWCLYEKIKLFCRYESKNVTCPLPDAPLPIGSSRQSTPGADDLASNSIYSVPEAQSQIHIVKNIVTFFHRSTKAMEMQF